VFPVAVRSRVEWTENGEQAEAECHDDHEDSVIAIEQIDLILFLSNYKLPKYS